MNIQFEKSDSEVLRIIGERLHRTRLERNMTQAQLADLAGVGKRTIERLEAGSAGTQLSGFIRICRALGLIDRFDLFIPEPAPSPIQQLKLRGRQRKRASGKRGAGKGITYPTPAAESASWIVKSPPRRKWKWGDER